jgi:hypothetical protein
VVGGRVVVRMGWDAGWDAGSSWVVGEGVGWVILARRPCGRDGGSYRWMVKVG